MEDKELFDFFKNRSASFDEMPSDNVWNSIQANIESPKKSFFFPASKLVKWSVLGLVAVVIIVFFIPKHSQTTIDNPKRNEVIVEANSSKKDSVIKINTPLIDTLKRKRVFKKNLANSVMDTVQVFKKLQPVLKIDSIKVATSKVIIDSLNIRPQVKGNRLLFETKQLLTVTEFDVFVQKVLKQTEQNFGSLIVVKAKGHKPFRHLVKFPDKKKIPHNAIMPTYYTTKVVLKDSLVFKDSIYFNIKDR